MLGSGTERGFVIDLFYLDWRCIACASPMSKAYKGTCVS